MIIIHLFKETDWKMETCGLLKFQKAFNVFNDEFHTILLWTGGLWCAQAGQLLWGFRVNDGSVATLQVLSDAHHVTVAVVQLPFGKELLELWSAIDALDWRGRERARKRRGWSRERGGGINWIRFFPLRNVLQEDIGNILLEMQWGQAP